MSWKILLFGTFPLATNTLNLYILCSCTMYETGQGRAAKEDITESKNTVVGVFDGNECQTFFWLVTSFANTFYSVERRLLPCTTFKYYCKCFTYNCSIGQIYFDLLTFFFYFRESWCIVCHT